MTIAEVPNIPMNIFSTTIDQMMSPKRWSGKSGVECIWLGNFLKKKYFKDKISFQIKPRFFDRKKKQQREEFF
jgi:hypothetical protein